MGISRKLAPSWDGPHRVIHAPFNAPNVFLCLYDDPDGTYEKVHMQRLKRYTERAMDTVHSLSPLQLSLAMPGQITP